MYLYTQIRTCAVCRKPALLRRHERSVRSRNYTAMQMRLICVLVNFCSQRHSIHGMMEDENVIRPHQEMASLSLDDKKFLLAVERGDVAGVRK